MEGWGCDRVSIPDGWPGFDPAVKGCGADRSLVGVDPTEPLGFDPTERDRVRSHEVSNPHGTDGGWGFDP